MKIQILAMMTVMPAVANSLTAGAKDRLSNEGSPDYLAEGKGSGTLKQAVPRGFIGRLLQQQQHKLLKAATAAAAGLKRDSRPPLSQHFVPWLIWRTGRERGQSPEWHQWELPWHSAC